MPKLLADPATLWYALGSDAELDARIQRWLGAVRAQARAGVAAPAQARDLHAVLDEMRLVKDAHEIDTMRRAARISAAAHLRAMRTTRPGCHEYEIEAELHGLLQRHLGLHDAELRALGIDHAHFAGADAAVDTQLRDTTLA